MLCDESDHGKKTSFENVERQAMLVIAALSLGLAVSGSARPTDGENGRYCRVGDAFLPESVYEAYAGWECFGRAYSKRMTTYVCGEKSGDVEYNIPCFKTGSKMMSFSLKRDETVLELLKIFKSRELSDEIMRCYLDLVSACEFSPDGWLGRRYRAFLFNATDNCDLGGQSRFHVALLSISLIIAVPVVVLFSYCSLDTGSVTIFHCRNLIIALVFRTFFTLLIETEVISKKIELPEEPLGTWAGCEALASFETVTLNLVLACWLIFTFYLSEYSQCGFAKEPDIKSGAYIVLGLSVVLSVIWMIIMGVGEYGMCWMEKTPVHWVNDSLRIGFIILQIALISVAVYRIVTETGGPDDSEKDMLRRVTIFTCILSPLFLLQFSLSAGRAADYGNDYVYAEYFFDGMQCGLTSVSYLFVTGVHQFLAGKFRMRGNKKCHIALDTGRRPDVEPEDPKILRPVDNYSSDVIYSSVLGPERFEKTLKLYSRMNIIPQLDPSAMTEDAVSNDADDSSVVSEYYDVDSSHTDSTGTVYNDVVEHSGSQEVPKNKFYSSKYLIEDTDTSGSDDSVKEPSKVESSSVEAPRREANVKAVAYWHQNCRSEFQSYAEREFKNKRFSGNELYRSLSGNVLTIKETPNSVRVITKTSPRARRGSAPSLLATAKPKTYPTSYHDGLPSIYDDLKHCTRRPNPRVRGRKPYLSPEIVLRNRYGENLIRDRRKTKSMDALEEPEKGGYSCQLNALLGSRSDTCPLQPGDLRNNKFSYNTERLNAEAGDCEDRKT